MSSALEQIRAELKELRSAINGLTRQNVRTGIVDRDEQRLARDIARGGMVEVTVPLDLFVPLGGATPADADYLVKTANAGLSAERVVTDNTQIAADWSVAGQVKFTIVDPRVTFTPRVIAANDDVLAGECIIANTVAGVVTATLPAAPANGDRLMLLQLGPNALTAARNGKKIDNAAADYATFAPVLGQLFIYESTLGSWFRF